jgi:hypothetical protein
LTAVAFLDGDGQKKYLEASGTGTSGDPYIFKRVQAGATPDTASGDLASMSADIALMKADLAAILAILES